MQPIYGMSLIVLLSSAPVFAADPAAQKLLDFKAAKAALAAKIDSFIVDVKACNVPLPTLPGMTPVKDQIIDGFTGTQPQSAKNLLDVHEKDVSDDAANADARFADLDKSRASCSVDNGTLLGVANKVGQDVAANLTKDASNYNDGIVVANKKRALVVTPLSLRQMLIDRHPDTATDEEKALAAPCNSAKNKVAEMDALNKTLADSLTALQTSYASKVVFVSAAISAPNSCKSSPAGLVRNVNFDGNEAVPTLIENTDVTPFDRNTSGLAI